MNSDEHSPHYPSVAHIRARVHEMRLMRFILRELQETGFVRTLEDLDDALVQLESAYDKDLRQALTKLLRRV
jgi:uncharacterized protein YihD (DUF1040 family)